LVNWHGVSNPALGKNWIKGISKRIYLLREQNCFSSEARIDGNVNLYFILFYFFLFKVYGNRVNYSLSEAGFIV
jgi:hypothetical protein